MLICPKCKEECEVDEIHHDFVDDAYGQRTVFFELELRTLCCGEEVYYDDYT